MSPHVCFILIYVVLSLILTMFVAVELIKFIIFIELAQVAPASVSKQVLVHNLRIEISFSFTFSVLQIKLGNGLL